MLRVLILYISGGTYSLKSTPNDRFFEKLFMAILFTLRVFARNLLSGNRRSNTFRISFWCLAWNSNPGFLSNKPTHYLLDVPTQCNRSRKWSVYNQRRWLEFRMDQTPMATVHYYSWMWYCLGFLWCFLKALNWIMIFFIFCLK